MLQDVSSGFGRKNSKHGEFAVTSKEVSPLVKLLNLLMVIHFLVVILDEDVFLDEVLK